MTAHGIGHYGCKPQKNDDDPSPHVLTQAERMDTQQAAP